MTSRKRVGRSSLFRSREDLTQAVDRLRAAFGPALALDPRRVRFADPVVLAAGERIDAGILEIFGAQSKEYGQWQRHSFLVAKTAADEDAKEHRFIDGLRRSRQVLRAILRALEENKADFLASDLAAMPRTADLPTGLAGAVELHREGRHAEAVAAA